MADDVLINKAAIIEKHLNEFLRLGEIFLMRHDAAPIDQKEDDHD